MNETTTIKDELSAKKKSINKNITNKKITVEVVYALPDEQSLLSLEVTEGCTAMEAVRQSGIAEQFAEIDLDSIKIGLFSKGCDNDQQLKAGDRVELYRPLLADPKEIRKRRAAEMAEKKKKEEALSKLEKKAQL